MDDRAQIAAMALTGLIATPVTDGDSPGAIARKAVEFADELLAELSKTPPPARTKETPRPPTDPGESEAGEPKGAAGPDANRTPHSEKPLSDKAADRPVTNLASPVSVFDCEARFEHDPVCPGPVVFDPVSKGRFCGLHAQIPEGHRREMHRLHGHRNRPLAPVTRLAG